MRHGLVVVALLAGSTAREAVGTSVVVAEPWKGVAAAGVDVSLSPLGKPGIRMVYDFRGGSGWAGVRRAVALEFPEDWTLSFRVRGAGTPNTLEVKFLDATGENVWWARRESFAAGAEWRTVAVRKRQVSFAWGPAGGGKLRHAAAIEIVLSAGQGGRGFLEVEEPVLAERPREASPAMPQASKIGAGILVDLGGPRELSGLVVDWPVAIPPRFSVEVSSDGHAWTTVRRVAHGGARRAWLHLPETEAQLVRLVLPPGDFGLPRIDVKPVEWAPTANDFVGRIAKDVPRGLYPRAFLGEQTYWTVAGVDADTEEVLVGEDGALEPGKGSFSLEPFLFAGGRLVTWSDAAITQSLERGDLPIPRVTWKAGDLDLDVTALVDGPPGASVLRARYRVRNAGAAAVRVRLFVAIRPFLVNPPTQFLNAPHGVGRIDALSVRSGTLTVNGTRTVVALPLPAAAGVAAFDAGPISDFLLKGELPRAREIRDETGLASGAFAWDLDIPARGAEAVVLDVPLHAGVPDASVPLTLSKKIFDDRLTRTSAAWGNAVDRVRFRIPPFAESLVATLRSTLAYVLVNRDGPWIQPGSRAYERSWIRDGALTSSALLRLGHSAEVRDFLLAFAEKQFADGRIPCCVDSRGADPVPEHDSHGEFLFLAAEYFRFTNDAATLVSLWPRIEKTVAAIDALRRQRLTPEYDAPEKRAFRGLLPESISHEGYSDKPVHSYWDDAFARKGLADAVELAAALAHPDEAPRFAAIRDALEADLLASIARTIEVNHLETIPASVEKHDFDPTSTTTALWPCGLQEKLPQKELFRTFDRYVREARERRDGTRDGRQGGDAYTPYELRNVGALVRLGRKEDAHEMLAFFLKDRRPAAWNQWAEVVGRDPRAPRFVGDMPHTWVGTDFIRSFLDFFAIEREGMSGGSLLVGAGLPEEWVRAPGGAGVEGLRTIYGSLDLAVSASGGEVRAWIAGVRVPPAGLALAWPLGGVPRAATVNGKPAGIRGREILVREVPAEVVVLP
ncbi:MAG TPA: coagulation factor 5/8 type domain-containing protein [Thermoanaerobaculia bacterium]|nr:coagulation factor 5/8 type domain-containing protein [Thermoanaerobaculia bacterium]